MEDTEPEQTLH